MVSAAKSEGSYCLDARLDFLEFLLSRQPVVFQGKFFEYV